MKRLPVILTLTLALLAIACGRGAGDTTDPAAGHALPDTLRVGTLYSPASYFSYRGQMMGYDYDLISQMAKDKGMELKFEVAPTLAAAVAMLDSGKVDILAYEVPVTAEYKEKVVACGPENITTQVLVQPLRDGKPEITDVTQLIGREVYVEKDSKYHHRLINLNNSVGGGILIRPIERERLITEDLIDLVNRDSIPLTIVDSDIARINRTYYPKLDISLEVSFPQRASWAVAPQNRWLADSVDAWIGGEAPQRTNLELLKRYFETSKRLVGVEADLTFPHGKISPYDHLFRDAADDIDWDWRMMAAMGYVESRFDTAAVSWAGARGLMQVMPRTAAGFGVKNTKSMHRSDVSIATAAKLLASLDKSLSSRVPDPVERKKFIIASYNSGLGHVLDAMALAKKYGLNPQKWDDNVEKAILWKQRREYYNDPVVKFGYSRGRETYDYVHRVMRFYDAASRHVPA